MSGMLLTVNGQPQDIPGSPSLQDAIALLCKAPDVTIAELNGIIVDRALWPSARLAANDRLELISFVGGG